MGPNSLRRFHDLISTRGPELHLGGFKGVSGSSELDPLYALSEGCSAAWRINAVEVGREAPSLSEPPSAVIENGAALGSSQIIVNVSRAELLVFLNLQTVAC